MHEHKQAALTGLAAIAALAGCTATVPPIKESLMRTVTCGNNNACVATVSITDAANHKASVDPSTIKLQRGNRVHLYWQLPAGCAFVTPAGDGVFIKTVKQAVDAAGQFDEQYAADRIANNKPKREQISDLYYWFAKNDKKSTDNGYEYRVEFHCKIEGGQDYDEVPFKADPILFNEGP